MVAYVAGDMKKETMTIRGWGRVENVYLSLLPSTADQLINTWLPSHHHDASVHFGWVQCPVGNANEGHPLFACYNLHVVYAIFISISIDQRFPFVGGSSTCIIFRQNASMETILFLLSFPIYFGQGCLPDIDSPKEDNRWAPAHLFLMIRSICAIFQKWM